MIQSPGYQQFAGLSMGKNPMNQLESPKPGTDNIMQSINVKVKNTNMRSPKNSNTQAQPPNNDLKSVASSKLYDSQQRLEGSGGMITTINGGRKSLQHKEPLQIQGHHQQAVTRSPKRFRSDDSSQQQISINHIDDSFIVGHASMNQKPNLKIKDLSNNSFAQRKVSLTRIYSGERPSSYKRDQTVPKPGQKDIDGLRIDGDRLYDPNKTIEATRNLPNGSQSSKNNSVGKSLGGSSRKGSARLFDGQLNINYSKTPKFENNLVSPSNSSENQIKSVRSKDGKYGLISTGPNIQRTREQNSNQQHQKLKNNLTAVQETTRTIQTVSSDGEVIPTIAVSRRYMNTNGADEEIVDHSYHSSVKNYQQRYSQRDNSIILTNNDIQNADLKRNSLDLRSGLPHPPHTAAVSTREHLKNNQLFNVRPSVSPTVIPEHLRRSSDFNNRNTTTTAGGVNISTTRGIQETSSFSKVIYVQDGDMVYEISGRDLAFFKRLMRHHREEEEDLKRKKLYTGRHKQQIIEKTFSLIPYNLRPCSTNSILNKIQEKEKIGKREKSVLAQFFGLLKSQGKARIYRGEINESISAIYQRDVIYSSAMNSYIKNSIIYSERPNTTLQQPTAGPQLHDQLVEAAKNQKKQISGIPSSSQNNFSMLQNNSSSPKTVYKRIGSGLQQQLNSQQQEKFLSTDDYNIMIGNPYTKDEASASAHTNMNRGPFLTRPHSEYETLGSEINRLRVPFLKSIVQNNQENIGDTRNIIANKTATSALNGRAFKGINYRASSQTNNEQKIDTKRSGSSCMIKPSPHIMNITAVRRLVNFQKNGSPKERQNRQGQQQSSFAESNNLQVMKPIIAINDDLDIPDRYSHSIYEVTSLQGKQKDIPQSSKIKSSEKGGNTLYPFTENQTISEQQIHGTISPSMMNQKINNLNDTLQLDDTQVGVEIQCNFEQTLPLINSWGVRQTDSSNNPGGFQYMKTVRVQEYKFDLEQQNLREESGDELQPRRHGGSIGSQQSNYNSSQKNTKFSNTHIKMHIGSNGGGSRLSSARMQLEQSPNNNLTIGQTHSATSSVQNNRPQLSLSAHRAQSLRKNKINTNFRSNSLSKKEKSGITIQDPKLKTLEIIDVRKSKCQQDGVSTIMNGSSNLNKIFYDTPQFGVGNDLQNSFEFNSKIQTPLGFGIQNNYEDLQKTAMFQMNLNMNLQKKTFSVPEEHTQEIIQEQLSNNIQSEVEQSKKNVLISKKQQSTHSENQFKLPQVGSPSNVQDGMTDLDTRNVIANSLIEAVSSVQEPPLDHIMEETCESVDSLGRDESTHTMKSNFIPGETNSFRKEVMGQMINIDSSGKKQRRRIQKSKGTVEEINGQLNNIGNDNINAQQMKPRVVHSKRSISPIDISKIRHVQGDQDKVSLNQFNNTVEPFVYGNQQLVTLTQNNHPSTKNLNSNKDQLYVDEGNLDNLAQIDGSNSPMRIISKVGKSTTSSQAIELPLIHQMRVQRHQDNLIVEQTKGSYPLVSSKGEFDVQPLYDHGNNESQSLSNLNQIFNHSASKSMQRNISLNLKSIEKNQKRQLMQMKPMIDVPQVEPLSNTTPMQMSYTQVPGGVTSTAQAKNVSSNSIFQYENFQMKARLVTRKANNGKATNSKDQALSTNGEGGNPKMKPKSNSIAHMYELSAQGMPAEMINNAAGESPSRIQDVNYQNEMDTLEPRQVQMLKRNINVYRRANQRLKEIKRQKSAGLNSSRTSQPSLGKTTINNNDQLCQGGADSLGMVNLNTGNNTFNKQQMQNPLNLLQNVRQNNSTPGQVQHPEIIVPSTPPMIAQNQSDINLALNRNNESVITGIRNDESASMINDSVRNHLQLQPTQNSNVRNQHLDQQKKITSLPRTAQIQSPKIMMRTSKTNQASPKCAQSLVVGGIVSLTNDRVNQQLIQMIMNQQIENPRTNTESLKKPGTAAGISVNYDQSINQPLPFQSTFSKTKYKSNMSHQNEHRRIKSSVGFYNNQGGFHPSSIGRCTTAAHSNHNQAPSVSFGSTNSQLRRSIEYKQRANHLSGLFIPSVKHQIPVSQTSHGIRSPASRDKLKLCGNHINVQIKHQIRPGTSAI